MLCKTIHVRVRLATFCSIPRPPSAEDLEVLSIEKVECVVFLDMLLHPVGCGIGDRVCTVVTSKITSVGDGEMVIFR